MWNTNENWNIVSQVAKAHDWLERSQIGLFKKDEFQKVSTRCQQLTERYSVLGGRKATPLDYSDPISQYSYLYKYAVGHAVFFFRIFYENEHLKKLLDQQNLRIVCIGGGPGSDALGVLKTLQYHKWEGQVDFVFLDRQSGWEKIQQILIETPPSNITATTSLLSFEAQNNCDAAIIDKLSNADLCTISFLCSELYQHGDACKKAFANTISHLPKHSVLCIQDNAATDNSFQNWILEMTVLAGLTVMWENSYPELTLGGFEQVTNFKYYKDIMQRPRMKGQVYGNLSIKN